MKMRKIFPKHTDPADEFRKVCDQAYIYERDENGRLWKRRAGQIFVLRHRTEDEIVNDILAKQCQKLCEGTAYINMLGGITDENIR